MYLVGGREACIIGGGLDLNGRLLLLFFLSALFTLALSLSLAIITFSAWIQFLSQLPHGLADISLAALSVDSPAVDRRQ